MELKSLGDDFQVFHVPVLVTEILKWLALPPSAHVIDCTLGTGQTALAILEQGDPFTRLLGIDRDPETLEMSRRTLAPFQDRVVFQHGNFCAVKRVAQASGFAEVDGIVFDLGLSSLQLARADRGFSFAAEGPLDMRMDPSEGATAAELVNRASESELAQLLREYGEERYARRIARAIVQRRRVQPIHTTSQLVDVVRQAVPPAYRRGRLHCATRTFQSLRLAVNQELAGLDQAIVDAADLLKPGGRLCIIAFHSLEDRIVKRTVRALAEGPAPRVRVLTKKPVTPTVEERRRNPRSRSAKLRVAERVAEGAGA